MNYSWFDEVMNDQAQEEKKKKATCVKFREQFCGIENLDLAICCSSGF